MSQNRSTAVMQRRVEAHNSLDDFPTPPWATRALCEWLGSELGTDLSAMAVREPCANRGFMVRPLGEYFGAVIASDVHDYGYGFAIEDFLFPGQIPPVDFTCMNPPFRLAEQFVERALATSRVGCAAILRSAFLEGVGRFERLYSNRPPSFVLQFAERVPMVKGRVDPEAASATSYAWLIWLHDQPESRLRWIAPCRKRLERATDYPDAAA
ncbi:hypothetical protein [Sphingobium sp. UBA5915]|uniref:hypothetical protein n=1 Tax=Sphingobium sp. UBA5915 TaxID=1947530 RepID=UPI0025D3663A|nr:hypothetical protein [Sphingobium sp. UBA5915]